ncbi:MAG: alcohol dehydrogenase family protein [Pseudomonadota bacterium]
MTTTPDTMRAFVLEGHGDFDKLVLHSDWPVPRPASHQVLIKVHACGLNNTDVNTRTGWYSKEVTESTTGSSYDGDVDDDGGWGGASIQFPRIQGGDAAGTVVAVGADADTALVGRRVLVDTVLRDWSDPLNMNKCGYLGSEADGGYADFMIIDHRNVRPIDCDLSNAELATFAISYSTAENMLNRALVGDGDAVLIPGASGGVGSALIQLAKRRGAKTIALASKAKHDDLRALAPDALLPREPGNLKSALRDAIGSDTVSVVADVVGGDQFPVLLDVLERGGRYTCSGAIAGPIVELDLRTMYLKDLTFTGATILSPNIFGDLVGYIERGEIKPLLAQSFPLEDLHDAQRAFIAKKHIGNIVVTMDV